MPMVPRAPGRQVGTDPLLGVRKTAAETPLSMGAGLAEAQGQTADAVGRLGQTVTAIATRQVAEQHERELQRQDDVVDVAATNRVSDFLHAELNDTTTGAFHTVRGKDALGLTEAKTARFDEFAGTLREGKTPRQLARLDKMLAGQRASMVRMTDDYAGQQMETYATGEYQGAVKNSIRDGIVNAAEHPFKIGEALQQTDDIITKYAAHKGWGPDQRKEMLAEAHSQIHAGVIDEQLAQGHDEDAAFYFKHMAAAELLPEEKRRLEVKLEVATTLGQGLRASNAVWAAMGPKADDEPINVDKMQEAINEKYADQPKVREAALQNLRERKSATDAGRASRAEAITAKLAKAVLDGKTLGEMQRMDEFLNAPATVRKTFTDYMVREQEHAADRSDRVEDRAYRDEERVFTRGQHERTLKAQREETTGWATYWDKSNPTTLAAMTEDQIMSLLPEIGQPRVNALMEGRRRLQASADAVKTATIDESLFRQIADGAGYAGAHKTKASDDEKAELGALKSDVLAVIAERETGNKKLSRDEKAQIMHSMVDQKVMVSRWFGYSSTEQGARLVQSPESREKAFVPLTSIPQPNITEAVNILRANDPRLQRPVFKPADIVKLYQDRIQRAYAADVLGMGKAEVYRRLRGE